MDLDRVGDLSSMYKEKRIGSVNMTMRTQEERKRGEILIADSKMMST